MHGGRVSTWSTMTADMLSSCCLNEFGAMATLLDIKYAFSAASISNSQCYSGMGRLRRVCSSENANSL